MRTITDREKLILVTSAMGQQVQTAQATTLVVFDTLANSAVDNVFFQGANTRALPDTNLNTNKLPYKNNLAIDYISFFYDDVEEATPARTYGDARFTLTIGNQDVLKDISLYQSIQQFPQNYSAQNNIVAFIPKTKLIIPSDTTFKVTLNSMLDFGESLRCVIKGYGTIKGGGNY